MGWVGLSEHNRQNFAWEGQGRLEGNKDMMASHYKKKKNRAVGPQAWRFSTGRGEKRGHDGISYQIILMTTINETDSK